HCARWKTREATRAPSARSWADPRPSRSQPARRKPDTAGDHAATPCNTPITRLGRPLERAAPVGRPTRPTLARHRPLTQSPSTCYVPVASVGHEARSRADFPPQRRSRHGTWVGGVLDVEVIRQFFDFVAPRTDGS